MEKLLLLDAAFSVELMKYLYVYYINSERKIRFSRKKLGLLFIIFGMVTVFTKNAGQTEGAAMVALIPIGVLFFLTYDGRFRIWECIITMFTISSVEFLADAFIRELIDTNSLYFVYKIFIEVVNSFVFVLLYGGIILAIRKYNEKHGRSESEKSLKIVLVIACISLCIDGTIIYDLDEIYKSHQILAVCSFTGVILLGSQVSNVLEVLQRLNQSVKQERELRAMQRDYYQAMRNAESEIHKYRHDMVNHLVVVEAYLMNAEYDKAKEYFTELKDGFLSSTRNAYAIGNEILDAISFYYLKRIEPYTNIVVKGNAANIKGIYTFHLCTIYANLVKNAVEEIERLREKGHQKLELYITVETGKDFLHIIIKNTARDNPNFKGMNTITEKEDKEIHGIGLQNVLQAIKKEQGAVDLYKDGEYVVADVGLPLNKTMEEVKSVED